MRSKCNKTKNKTKTKGSEVPPAHGPIERFGDVNGPDVLLLVGYGGDCHSFLISESILYQLGPRWRCLLSNRSIMQPKGLFSGLFGGRFSNSPKTLNLQREHPDAIRIILLIATLQFIEIPKALDFPEIVHLADVAVRYDAHLLLANYIDAWLAPYRERLLWPGYEEWLFIAHQFGYETEYLELAKYLAIHCEVESSGERLLAPGTSHILQGRFPIDTLAHIHEGRRQILHKMLKAIYDLWTSMSEGVNCKVPSEGTTHAQSSCAAINLLEFTNYLRAGGLFPMLRTVTTFRHSPHDLAAALSNAKNAIPITGTVSVSRRGSAPIQPPRHIQCHIGFRLAPIMAKILEDVSWPVEISTLMHIKKNGKKMGKRSQRSDEASKFLSKKVLLERRHKVVRKIEASQETNPNVLNVR